MKFERVVGDIGDLSDFLRTVDLTLAGLDDPAAHLWVDRAAGGEIIGTAGFELSSDGRHALIRSVAVSRKHRRSGTGSELARHAIEQAKLAGARRAWLFSRRSGPFWQKFGFVSADPNDLVDALPLARQVQLFKESRQIEREVAWSRDL